MEPTRDGVLDFLADRAMGILALLFVLSYALIRPAYERFYEPLGLRPEDLGLNQIEMISSGAAIFTGLILIPVVQIMLGVTLYLMLQRRWLILQILVPAAVFILAGYGLYRSLTILSMFFYITLLSALGYTILCFVLFGRTGAARNYRERLFPAAPITGTRLLIGTFFAFSLLLFVVFGYQSAFEAGDKFMQTGSVPGPWSLLLNIKSTRVSVVPVEKDTLKICSGRHEAYLLGYANDAHFVLLIPFLFEEGQFESPDLPSPPVTSPPPLLDPRRSQQPQQDDPSTSLPGEEADTTNLSFGYPEVFRLPEDDYEMIRSLEYRNEKVEYGNPCASPRRAS